VRNIVHLEALHNKERREAPERTPDFLLVFQSLFKAKGTKTISDLFLRQLQHRF